MDFLKDIPLISQLPPELKQPILDFLSLEDILNLRLVSKAFKQDVENLYSHFRMEICGDRLNVEQIQFVRRINLEKITFKRVAKPVRGSTLKVPELKYKGPSQFLQVGGIQVCSLSVPSLPKSKIPYDIKSLKNYVLWVSICKEDIFNSLSSAQLI